MILHSANIVQLCTLFLPHQFQEVLSVSFFVFYFCFINNRLLFRGFSHSKRQRSCPSEKSFLPHSSGLPHQRIASRVHVHGNAGALRGCVHH